MKEWAWLVVWLIGLFGLIGAVLAAVLSLVRNDTTEHDRQFLWSWRRWDRSMDQGVQKPIGEAGETKSEAP
jgi:hypothetical protein